MPTFIIIAALVSIGLTALLAGLLWRINTAPPPAQGEGAGSETDVGET